MSVDLSQKCVYTIHITINYKERINMADSPKTNYLSNKELLPAVREAKEKGYMTPKLAKMLQLLCSKYATKGCYVNYSYNEDMQGYAMFMLVRTWNKFNLEKSNNPFAFYTQCIKHSFIQYLKHEKKHRAVRDMLLVAQGMNPSFGYDENGSDCHIVEDEQDYFYHTELAQELQQLTDNDDDEFNPELVEQLEQIADELIESEEVVEDPDNYDL